MQVNGYEHPEELLYHPEFIWVKLDGETALCGFNDFYQKLAGEIAFIDLPGVGERVSQGERIGTLETGKWIGKVIAPLSGEIVAVNPLIDKTPELINTDPYGDGWLFKIRISDISEVQNLLSGKSAIEWLKDEIKKHS